jgi:hypothetical protein
MGAGLSRQRFGVRVNNRNASILLAENSQNGLQPAKEMS